MRRQVSMSAERAGLPDDLPGELLGIDEHDCLGRQSFRGGGARYRQVVTQDRGRFGAGWHLERAPEQIYAAAGKRWRVTGIPAEF